MNVHDELFKILSQDTHLITVVPDGSGGRRVATTRHPVTCCNRNVCATVTRLSTLPAEQLPMAGDWAVRLAPAGLLDFLPPEQHFDPIALLAELLRVSQ